MSIEDTGLPVSPFIHEPGRPFYKLSVFVETGEFFLTDPVDYQQRGFVMRFRKDGSLINSMEAGIIPGGMCQRYLPEHWTE